MEVSGKNVELSVKMLHAEVRCTSGGEKVLRKCMVVMGKNVDVLGKYVKVPGKNVEVPVNNLEVTWKNV